MTIIDEAAEAAAVLRRLLAAVESGDLLADGPLGAGVVTRLAGAVAAFEAIASPDRRMH